MGGNLLEERKALIEIHLTGVKITPAILTNSSDTFIQLVQKYNLVFESVDIDVIDNTIIQGSVTLTPDQILDLLSEIRVKNHESNLIKLNFHLMVLDYSKYITPDILKISNEIVFQFESMDLFQENLKLHFEKYFEINPQIKFGLSISPNSCKEFEQLLKNHPEKLSVFNTLQLMTVYPGKQGSKFMEDPLKVIPSIRKLLPNVRIKVDGGLNPQTLIDISTEAYEALKNIDEISIGSFFQNAI